MLTFYTYDENPTQSDEITTDVASSRHRVTTCRHWARSMPIVIRGKSMTYDLLTLGTVPATIPRAGPKSLEPGG